MDTNRARIRRFKRQARNQYYCVKGWPRVINNGWGWRRFAPHDRITICLSKEIGLYGVICFPTKIYSTYRYENKRYYKIYEVEK